MAYPYPKAQKALGAKVYLSVIKRAVAKLKDYDPYGDLQENFCELDKHTQIAERLIKMIDDDIANESSWLYR